MKLTDALKLVHYLIRTQEVHQDYERCMELAETYRIFITGLQMEKKLIQYVPRESVELFAQRCRITKAITPAVAATARQPFNKVVRTKRVRKGVKMKDEKRVAIVQQMLMKFYGGAQKKDRGLDYWMQTRFLETQFIDPNTWLVIEWDAAASPTTPVQPRPFEVRTEWARNYFAVNDDVKWLFVRQPITYMSYEGSALQITPNDTPEKDKAPGVIPIKKKEAKRYDGFRYTLYDEDVTVVYEQVDRSWMENPENGFEIGANQEWLTLDKDTYLVTTGEPKIGYAPVFRIGYKRDEATNGRTFVNPWHDALCFFEKSVKAVSELDLTITQHTFPQKVQYIQQCIGGPDKARRCNQGKLADGTNCTVCGGSGIKVHTTAQDTMMIPMPDDPKDMFDLDKLIAYKAPPIEILEFQNKYVRQTSQDVQETMYNSQAYQKTSATSVNGTNPIKTATEVNTNMDAVYDTLEPFTEKYSEIYRGVGITCAILTGAKQEDVTVTHEFSNDLKMKTMDMLLNDRAVAVESGAPGFLTTTLDDDMAEIIYAGDELGQLWYQVKKAFSPFPGNTPDEIAMLMAGSYVKKAVKVLYSNFEQIFREIAMENPDFVQETDRKKQQVIVDKKVAQYLADLEKEQPTMTLNTFRDRNPANGGQGGSGGQGNDGDGNPGNDGDAGGQGKPTPAAGGEPGSGGDNNAA